jgi:hypothetical protein
MKALVQYSRGRLQYTGRMRRASFAAWTGTPAGRAALEQTASRVRFALLGRLRAAHHRMWRQIRCAARSDAACAALQGDVDAYLPTLGSLAFARGLPCVSVDLRRLVVVPRVMVDALAYARIRAALNGPAFAALDAGAPLRDWFAQTVVEDAAAAVAVARPSVRNPVPAGEEWIAVGVSERFEWSVPIDGPSWPGHYFVLELTRTPMTHTVRKAAIAAIAEYEASLPALTRAQRSDILRQATHSLDALLEPGPARRTARPARPNPRTAARASRESRARAPGAR